jgi:hypothetical protein
MAKKKDLRPATKAEIQTARERYAADSDNDIEIDDNAQATPSGEKGVWVQAWVYLPLQTCDDCCAKAPSIIGCPDGAEVCPKCFDSGNH